MNFTQALELMEQGKRVISKKDKDSFENQWLCLNKEGLITYMNEPWTPTPKWLLEYMSDEWINVEEDCDYHDCEPNNCKYKRGIK